VKAHGNFFDKVYEKLRIAKAEGKNVLDLSIGDPDLPPPEFATGLFINQMHKEHIYTYPQIYGENTFKETISDWAYRKHGVSVHPEYEVLPLLGVKEGIVHLALGTLGYGDVGAYATPSYPIYRQAIEMSKASSVIIETKPENGYLPDLESLCSNDLRSIKLLYLNYPNNPTGTVVDESFCKSLIDIALKHNIYICLDCVYSDIIPFSSYKHFSILSLPGAMDCCIEMYSFSKSFNLPGIRLGYAIGNRKLIENLKSIKTVVDVSAFKPIQYLGKEILEKDIRGELEHFYSRNNSVYAQRINKFRELFRLHNIEFYNNIATYYVWFNTKRISDGGNFGEQLFDDEGILIVPGCEFNSCDEGWWRISISRSDDIIDESIDKLIRFLAKLR